MKRYDVLLPYTRLPIARDLVLLHPELCVPHFEHCADPFDYANAITERWLQQRGFVIIEHDIHPQLWQLQQLIECEYPHCRFGYDYPDRRGPVFGLGLSKFNGRVIAATLDLADDLPRLRWGQLDDYLMRVLSNRGYPPHLHGAVLHAHGRAA